VGGSTDVGGHLLVDLVQRSGSKMLSQALGLDVPETEERSGRDLRFGIVGTEPGARGEDVGGDGNKLVHHVALMGPQRRRGPDQVPKAKNFFGGVAGVVSRRE
jgi:hypothetical protein